MKKNKSMSALAGAQHAKHLAIAALSVVLLAGCASTATVGSDGQSSIEPLITQAESEMSKGRRDQAIALLNQAAKESPTNVTPWLKIANIWFDEGNYPSSILAANEALARDNNNQEAKSLLVVSGLRVAAKAVQGLVPHNPVNPNARQEAENLTKSLRQALGEKVLVPADPEKSVSQAPRQRKKVAVRAAEKAVKAAEETVAKESHSVAAPQAGNVQKISVTVEPKVGISADPFKSLK
ncbi:hypothetical protein EDC30_101435 [Paucimonas lemoignei]|uniref:Uncharacterized protein n=1 Tax=Paucimonas lemoignei TaxID=29443 RepID=A0A4R3I627_PAULE|nr:tetratricopeptide repeat protein [Paucimonas lemoignei]TCS39479.1 hypothetical protein EDC30_101435 [Paucimonas lemoignei]